MSWKLKKKCLDLLAQEEGSVRKVWGDVLTQEQITALVQYTLEAASGAPVERVPDDEDLDLAIRWTIRRRLTSARALWKLRSSRRSSG